MSSKSNSVDTHLDGFLMRFLSIVENWEHLLFLRQGHRQVEERIKSDRHLKNKTEKQGESESELVVTGILVITLYEVFTLMRVMAWYLGACGAHKLGFELALEEVHYERVISHFVSLPGLLSHHLHQQTNQIRAGVDCRRSGVLIRNVPIIPCPYPV